MLQMQFNEIPQNIDKLLLAIEKGQDYTIVKNGKDIAKLFSLSNKKKGFQRIIEKVKTSSGIESHVLIEQERDSE